MLRFAEVDVTCAAQMIVADDTLLITGDNSNACTRLAYMHAL